MTADSLLSPVVPSGYAGEAPGKKGGLWPDTLVAVGTQHLVDAAIRPGWWAA